MRNSKKLNIILTIVFFLTGIAHTATGKIIYVDADATGANNGTSWADAYNYLQDALADADSAAKPVEVRVAQGIYRPDEDTLHQDGTGDRTASFQLINGVTIQGGYAGFGGSNPDARDIALYQTILSGDIGRPLYKYDNSYHIFYHPRGLYLFNTAILDGFTITGGKANGVEAHKYGAGMYNCGNSPTVKKCTFSNNSARYGGGIYNDYCRPRVEACTFTENSSDWGGGGMFNNDSSPTVNNCIFSGNSTGCGGGGMLNDSASPNVNNCKFTANSATCGGGISNYRLSNPNVNNCKFTANSAKYGGGMDNWYYSNPSLMLCTFIGNLADSGGGIYNYHFSDSTINSCTFTENSAWYDGGGMCNGWSSPTVINCIFRDNSARYGGGMFNYGLSGPTINNCSFADNNAPNGPAMACDSEKQSRPSTVTIVNCIVWNSLNWLWNNDNSMITVTYSDVEGGWPGPGNINAHPLFIDANNGDYHLLPDSPCIDAGTDAGVYTDIEGNIRPFDYPDIDNNGELPEFDMGAYEMLPWIKVLMKFTPQALNCRSSGKWIKAHFVLPAEFVVGDVDSNNPTKVAQFGIESEYMNFFVNEDGLVEIEAAFDRAVFCDAAGCGTIEITAIGRLTNGQYFYGTDTIKINKNSFECLATLSSSWLQTDCGKPDWCNGFDLDHDSIVNLNDLALMSYHWLEEL